MGWLIVYTSQENFSKYHGALKGIFNILLMPHTVMQSSVDQILNNEANEAHLQEKIQLMAKNQHLLQSTLSSEDYCKVGNALGALYGTIVLNLEKFKNK